MKKVEITHLIYRGGPKNGKLEKLSGFLVPRNLDDIVDESTEGRYRIIRASITYTVIWDESEDRTSN